MLYCPGMIGPLIGFPIKVELVEDHDGVVRSVEYRSGPDVGVSVAGETVEVHLVLPGDLGVTFAGGGLRVSRAFPPPSPDAAVRGPCLVAWRLELPGESRFAQVVLQVYASYAGHADADRRHWTLRLS